MCDRRKFCREIAVILIGSFILATSIYFIQARNNIADGGFLGIALVLKNLFNLSPSTTILVLDIPFVLISWKFLGKKAVIGALVGSVSFSFFYKIFETYVTFSMDLSNMLPVAAILGGLLAGIGLGMIMRVGGATGGDDILSLLVSKCTGISVGRIYMVFDLFVLALSLLYLNWIQIAYTMLSLVICSQVMDKIYYFGRVKEKKKMVVSTAAL